jgi:hypothetical protein
MIELVNATIKYAVVPLEVGPEFALRPCPQAHLSNKKKT